MDVILLTGAQGVGKTTLANYLVEQHGYVELTFAGPLRIAATQAWNTIASVGNSGLPHISVDDTIDPAKKDTPLGSHVLDGRPLTPRTLVQWFGTELMRQHVGENVWVYALLDAIERHVQAGKTRFVISDCRFSNEYEHVKRHLIRNYKVRRIRCIRILRGDTSVVELDALRSSAGVGHISNRGWMDLPADIEILNPMKKDGLQTWLNSVARRLEIVGR